MDFRKRDRVVESCNWLMVGVAAGWVAYVFAGLFSSQADSQAIWLPPAAVQQTPLSTEATSAPIWGPRTTEAKTSDRDTDSRQGRATASRLKGPLLRSPAPSPPRSTRVLGDAPYLEAPEVPIPPLSPLPPGLGPDF